MKKHLVFAFACMALFLTACGGGSSEAYNDTESQTAPIEKKEEPKPIEMDFMSAFSMDNNSKLVSIEGYLQLPSTMYTSGNSGSLNFSQRPGQRYGDDIRVSLNLGKCKNCMAKVADKYTADDLKVTADDGKTVIGPNQRVRITGHLSMYEASAATSPSNLSLSIRKGKVEKVEEIELDYAAMQPLAITPENLFDSTLRYSFSMVEGKIQIPSMLFMNNDVNLNIPIGKEKLSVSFLFGAGPNTIEDIPKDYGKKDFKIHDYQDKIIDLNKPVKLYGTRTPPREDYGGILYVERIEQ